MPSPHDSLDDLVAFLAASPSPYHAVEQAAARLEQAGFALVDESTSWHTLPERAMVARGGALVAWHRPESARPADPWRVVGAHTDSPNLRLKPRPDTGVFGWRQLAVEIYGGVLLNSWLDRDLGLSGRVVLADGTVRLVLVDRPLARVPQLAIHLDRDIGDQGLRLDRQTHLTPVWGLGTAREGDLATLLADELDVDATAIRAWDLMLHDLTPPTLLGRDRELLAAARLDNLVSCWSAVDALTRTIPAGVTAAVALFDHEEVGSESTTGAAGPRLESVIERVIAAAGGDTDDRGRATAGSLCVSADMAHAVHPNYPERHEPGHHPVPNAGPVIKRNANQRYATDALTEAAFRRVADAAGVPVQVFVSRNSMPCGSTIGPVTSTRLGIPTVDVGCAQLSMHSARELCGAEDPPLLARALHAFLAGG